MQREHDRVVEQLAGALGVGYPKATVHQNPSGERHFGIKGFYPDVVVCLKPAGQASRHLYEVETLDSLTERHSLKWKMYAALGCPFTLVVPSDTREVAQELLIRVGLMHADILTYQTIADGKLTFG